jgi:hypothetical protein
MAVEFVLILMDNSVNTFLIKEGLDKSISSPFLFDLIADVFQRIRNKTQSMDILRD